MPTNFNISFCMTENCTRTGEQERRGDRKNYSINNQIIHQFFFARRFMIFFGRIIFYRKKTKATFLFIFDFQLLLILYSKNQSYMSYRDIIYKKKFFLFFTSIFFISIFCLYFFIIVVNYIFQNFFSFIAIIDPN